MRRAAAQASFRLEPDAIFRDVGVRRGLVRRGTGFAQRHGNGRTAPARVVLVAVLAAEHEGGRRVGIGLAVGVSLLADDDLLLPHDLIAGGALPLHQRFGLVAVVHRPVVIVAGNGDDAAVGVPFDEPRRAGAARAPEHYQRAETRPSPASHGSSPSLRARRRGRVFSKSARSYGDLQIMSRATKYHFRAIVAFRFPKDAEPVERKATVLSCLPHANRLTMRTQLAPHLCRRKEECHELCPWSDGNPGSDGPGRRRPDRRLRVLSAHGDLLPIAPYRDQR